ncbi:VanZ family protein [Priestia sp. OVL9]|nr:VanZ family protein [Priestia sp. OVL9]
MILKRVLLVLLLLAISKFSHTPHLEVTSPSSWTNSSVWNHDATLWSVLHPSGEFFTAYSYGFNVEFITRKIAHLSFFGLLGLLFYWNLKKQNYRYIKAWLCVAAFAFLDEVHQAFIVGRDGRIIDVAVDSLGAAIALYLLYRTRKTAVKT